MTRLITLLLIFATCQAISQPKKPVYKFRIFTTDGKKIAGYLSDINDSVIVVSPEPLLNSKIETIPYAKINSIKIRRNHSIRKGLGIGVVTGLGLGAIIGFASYHEPDCTNAYVCIDFGPGFSTIGGAVIGGAIAGVVGLVAGSVSKRIQVNGNNQVKTELEKYIIQLK